MGELSLMTRVWSFVIIVSLVVGIWAAAMRIGAEGASRTVEIAVDMQDVLQLARNTGSSVQELLRSLKKAGVTSAAVYEDLLADVEKRGEVAVMGGSEVLASAALGSLSHGLLWQLLASGDVRPDYTYVIPLSGGSLDRRLVQALEVRATKGPRPRMIRGQGLEVLELPMEKDKALALAAGLSRPSLEAAAAAGLFVVPRYTNISGLSASQVDAIFEELKGGPLGTVAVFSGTEVLGFHGALSETADRMRSLGLSLGLVEFAPQDGSARLAEAMDFQVVRVHSITSGEMASDITPAEAVDRFVRAVTERGITLVYLRLFPEVQEAQRADVDLVAYNVGFAKSVASALKDRGHELGRASVLEDPAVNLPARLLMGAGVFAAGILALGYFVMINPLIQVALFIIGLFGFAAMEMSGFGILARQAVALGSAVAFPVLSAGLLLAGDRGGVISRLLSGGRAHGGEDLDRPSAPESPRPGALKSILWAVLVWLSASAVSITGGLLLAGILTDVRFMTKVSQFLGVKAMHVVPVALAAVLYWLYWACSPDERTNLRALLGRAVTFFDVPIRVKHVVILGVIALMGLIYVTRTGNFAVIPASGIEEHMRLFLEKTLVVRPRTKEFLFGHPAFILAAVMTIMGHRRLLGFAAVFGAIGQVSMVNTFSHLHTPLIVTLIRTANGLALGLVVGLVAAAVYLAVARRYARVEVGGGGDDALAAGGTIEWRGY